MQTWGFNGLPFSQLVHDIIDLLLIWLFNLLSAFVMQLMQKWYRICIKF